MSLFLFPHHLVIANAILEFIKAALYFEGKLFLSV